VVTLRIAALLLIASSALADLRLGREISVGKPGNEITYGSNSRPAIATNGRDTLVFWATSVLNRPGTLVASRLGKRGTFRLADDAQPYYSVAAFSIRDAFVVLYLTRGGELRAVRVRADGRVLRSETIEKYVRNFAAASNGDSVLVATDTGNQNPVVLLSGDFSRVEQAGELRFDLVAVATDGRGYAIVTAHGRTLWQRFFDKRLSDTQKLLETDGEVSALSLTSSAGALAATWEECADRTCAVKAARFTREEVLGVIDVDSSRPRVRSRETGVTALAGDALLVWWGEADEYERLVSIRARRIAGFELKDAEPLTLSTERIGALAVGERLVIADAVVRAATIFAPLASSWPKVEMRPLSTNATFEWAHAVGANGRRLLLVRTRFHQLPPRGTAAATMLEGRRAREVAFHRQLYGVSTASDGHHIAICGFDESANLLFQLDDRPPRVLVRAQEWEESTAMVWTGDRYLIVWTVDHLLHMMAVDRDGAPLDAPHKVAPLATAAAEPVQKHPALANGGGEILLAWQEGDLWGESERLLRVMKIGSQERPLTLTHNGSSPSAAWNGRVFAIAWTAPSEERQVQGAILRGSTLAPFELPVSKYAADPALVSMDGKFVLACSDFEGRALTRVAHLDETGKMLDTITMPGGGEHFMRPYVAVSGARRVAVFHTRFASEAPYRGTYRAFVRFVDVTP